MRYPPKETAEKHIKILEESARLYKERGFHGVSVSEIMKATGLTHGPFYNHFDSKEDLMAECIAYTGNQALENLSKIKQSKDKTESYIDFYLSKEHRDGPGEGCLIAALGSQIRNEPKVRKSFTNYFRNAIDKMSDNFSWSKKTNLREDAIFMLSSLVGAMVIARSIDEEELSIEILETIKKRITL